MYRYKIHDKLYDISDFVEIHPGGKTVFDHLTSDTNITPMVHAYHRNTKHILDILSTYEIPLDNAIPIDYDTDFTYDTYTELKALVYQTIYEKKLSLYWSNQEIVYNISILALYLSAWIYTFIYAKTISYTWIVFLAMMSTGFGGLIFHEACHGAPFKNPTVNRWIGKLYPFADADHWSYHHNYLHHSFTNSEHDCDLLYTPTWSLFKYGDKQPLQPIHAFQYMYVPILFLFGGILSQKHNYFSVWNSNKWVVLIMLYYFGLYKVLLFFSILGFHFLFTANLSHIHERCIRKNRIYKNDFLYNQVSSAINYRTDDPITRFLFLGLDIQIEHHLFPKLPNTTLRKIQPVVRSYCEKKNIPYIEHPNVLPNIYSYINYLYKMGNTHSSSERHFNQTCDKSS
jgi:linoleoyl-CoA desaturase